MTKLKENMYSDLPTSFTGILEVEKEYNVSNKSNYDYYYVSNNHDCMNLKRKTLDSLRKRAELKNCSWTDTGYNRLYYAYRTRKMFLEFLARRIKEVPLIYDYYGTDDEENIQYAIDEWGRNPRRQIIHKVFYRFRPFGFNYYKAIKDSMITDTKAQLRNNPYAHNERTDLIEKIYELGAVFTENKTYQEKVNELFEKNSYTHDYFSNIVKTSFDISKYDAFMDENSPIRSFAYDK